jgi:S-DNA-T family DNA segregation ATPase FtsK/SpoIIIE
VSPRKVQKRSKRSVKSGSKIKDSSKSRLKTEVAGLLIAVAGVIMMLSIYFNGAAGPLGELIGRFAGGLFGLLGYIIPILTFIYGVITIFKPRTVSRSRKATLALILISLVSALLQAGLHDVAYYQNMNVGQYITTFYYEGVRAIGKGTGGFVPSGGVIGGIIGVPLLFVFKKLGTMIILITLAIISAMLLTRLSLAKAAKGVYRGTAGVITGMVDAVRKKKSERAEEIIYEDEEDEAAASEVYLSSTQKRARIVDFPLHEIRTKETAEPPGPDLEEQADITIVLGDEYRKGPRSAGTRPEKPAAPSKAAAAQRTADQEDTPVMDEAGNMAAREHKKGEYVFPPLELLGRSRESESNMRRIKATAAENARKLETTLESFGIGARVINVSIGPAFTRYELQPASGVKVSRIVNLTDDIALNLAASGVRIEAPIPGKAAIGVEVPNREVAPISLRSVLESLEFTRHESKLAVALGKDITGENMVVDLAKMPHILIAGATGSGKSVCINSIIISLLYKATPDDVRMLMIDTKVVELGVYNGIPHLLIPVVTDPDKAAGALRWAVSEMTTRYKLFADRGVRDILGYNAFIEENGEGDKLPQIVIIIDELADLMMVAPHEVEDSICRLAQMARAAGMHLVIATQRPSVNVITGVIKANIPSRIAFAVSSQVDSRTILDMAGAEKLLGKGDMLYYPVGIPKPIRVKGCFVSDKEVELTVDFVKNQMRALYDEEIMENISDDLKGGRENDDDDVDELLPQAIEAVIDCGQASVSFIQRKFKVGYARAGRIIDQMAERNIISGYEGSKPRRVLITRERWEEMKMGSRMEDET